MGDSGGNNRTLEEQPLKVPLPVTSYYDFWKPKFEDFFRAKRYRSVRLVLQAKKNRRSGSRGTAVNYRNNSASAVTRYLRVRRPVAPWVSHPESRTPSGIRRNSITE
jgi:hypothetical protein